MKKVDTIAAWLLVLMGLMHAGATTVAFPRVSLNAIWFLGTGLAILLAAALNLLRIHYAALVPALGRLAAMTNCVLLLLDLAVALQVPLRRNPQILVLFVLLGFLTVTSLRRPYAAAPAR